MLHNKYPFFGLTNAVNNFTALGIIAFPLWFNVCLLNICFSSEKNIIIAFMINYLLNLLDMIVKLISSIVSYTHKHI